MIYYSIVRSQAMLKGQVVMVESFLTSDYLRCTSTVQNFNTSASLNDSQEAASSRKNLHRLPEAIQVAKEVAEGLGSSQILQREVPEG